MRYLARRAVWTVIALLGVSVLIFLLVRLLPGNIVDIIAGTEGQLSREQRTAILREFGLEKPLPAQYLLWLWNMLQGNLGWSFRSSQPVATLLGSRLPITIELAFLSILGVALIGIPLGVLASVSQSVRVRTLVQIVGVLGLSLPNFWIAVLLIITASSLFGWLPALIYVSPWSDPWVNLQQMFLPVLSLTLGLSAVVVRMTRSSMLEVLGQDFVKVARAKGLSARAPDGISAGRGRDHRADLRPARAGVDAAQRRVSARLSGRPGDRDALRRHVRADQPLRRPALHVSRPAHSL
jgi:peptide/nickel transport system permease protein